MDWTLSHDLGELSTNNGSSTTIDLDKVGITELTASYQGVDKSSVLDVSTGSENYLKIMSEANGEGIEIGDTSITIDSTIIMYSSVYDSDSNLIGDKIVTWQSTDPLNSVDTISSKYEFKPNNVTSDMRISIESDGLLGDETGDITVGIGEIYSISITDASHDTIDALPNFSSDLTTTFYASGYNQLGQFVSLVECEWEIEGVIGEFTPDISGNESVEQIEFDAITSGEASLRIRYGNLTDELFIRVVPGGDDHIKIMTGEGNTGEVFDYNFVMTTDDTLKLWSAVFDSDDNFKGNYENSTWSGTGDFGWVSSTSADYVFIPNTSLENGAINVSNSSIDTVSGNISVYSGKTKSLVIIPTPTGLIGDDITNPINLTADDNLSLYALSFDEDLNDTIVEVTWIVNNLLGDTSITYQENIECGLNYVFNDTGKTEVKAIYGGLEKSVFFNIKAGKLEHIKLFDASGAKGKYYSPDSIVTITSDSLLQFYVAGFDSDDNYLGEEYSNFSTVGITENDLTNIVGDSTSFLPEMSGQTGYIIATSDSNNSISCLSSVLRVIKPPRIVYVDDTFSPQIGALNDDIQFSCTVENTGDTSLTIWQETYLEISDINGVSFTADLTVERICFEQDTVNLVFNSTTVPAQFAFGSYTPRLNIRGEHSDTIYYRKDDLPLEANGFSLSYLEVNSVTIANDTITNGQPNILIEVNCSNLTNHHLTNLAGVLKFEGENSESLDNYFSYSPSVIAEVNGLQDFNYSYLVDCDSIPYEGKVYVDCSVSGEDNNVSVNDQNSAFMDSMYVVEPPFLEYIGESLSPKIVTLGQSVQFRVKLKNTGGTSVFIDSSSTIFNLTDGDSNEVFTVHPATDLLYIEKDSVFEILFQEKVIPVGLNDVSLPVKFFVEGIDNNGLEYISSIQTLEGVEIQDSVVFEINQSSFFPKSVSQGQDTLFCIDVTNNGGADARLFPAESYLRIEGSIPYVAYIDSAYIIPAGSTKTIKFAKVKFDDDFTNGSYQIEFHLYGEDYNNQLFKFDTLSTNFLVDVNIPPLLEYNNYISPTLITRTNDFEFEAEVSNLGEVDLLLDNKHTFIQINDESGKTVFRSYLKNTQILTTESPNQILYFRNRIVPEEFTTGIYSAYLYATGIDSNYMVFPRDSVQAIVELGELRVGDPVRLSVTQDSFTPSTVLYRDSVSFKCMVENEGDFGFTISGDSLYLKLWNGVDSLIISPVVQNWNIQPGSSLEIFFEKKWMSVNSGEYEAYIHISGIDTNLNYYSDDDLFVADVSIENVSNLEYVQTSLIPNRVTIGQEVSFALEIENPTIGNNTVVTANIDSVSNITILDNDINVQTAELDYSYSGNISVESGEVDSCYFDSIIISDEYAGKQLYSTELTVIGIDEIGNQINQTFTTDEIIIDTPPQLSIQKTYGVEGVNPDTVTLGDTGHQLGFELSNSGSATFIIDSVTFNFMDGSTVDNSFIIASNDSSFILSGESSISRRFSVNILSSATTELPLNIVAQVIGHDQNSNLSYEVTDTIHTWEVIRKRLLLIDSVTTSQEAVIENQNHDWYVNIDVSCLAYNGIEYLPENSKIEFYSGKKLINNSEEILKPSTFNDGSSIINMGDTKTLTYKIDRTFSYNNNENILIRSVICGKDLTFGDDSVMVIGDSTSIHDSTVSEIHLLTEPILIVEDVNFMIDTSIIVPPEVDKEHSYNNLSVKFVLRNEGTANLHSYSDPAVYNNALRFLNDNIEDEDYEVSIASYPDTIYGRSNGAFIFSIHSVGSFVDTMDQVLNLHFYNNLDSSGNYNQLLTNETDTLLNNTLIVEEPAMLELSDLVLYIPDNSQIVANYPCPISVNLSNKGQDRADSVVVRFSRNEGEYYFDVLIDSLLGGWTTEIDTVIYTSSAIGVDTLKIDIVSSIAENIDQLSATSQPSLKHEISIIEGADIEVSDVLLSQFNVSAGQTKDWQIQVKLRNNGEGVANISPPDNNDINFYINNELQEDYIVKRVSEEFAEGGVNLSANEEKTLRYQITQTGSNTGESFIVFNIEYTDMLSEYTYEVTDSNNAIIVDKPAAVKIIGVVNKLKNPNNEFDVNTSQEFEILVTYENTGGDEIDSMIITTNDFSLLQNNTNQGKNKKKLLIDLNSNELGSESIYSVDKTVYNILPGEQRTDTLKMIAPSTGNQNVDYQIKLTDIIENNTGEIIIPDPPDDDQTHIYVEMPARISSRIDSISKGIGQGYVTAGSTFFVHASIGNEGTANLINPVLVLEVPESFSLVGESKTDADSMMSARWEILAPDFYTDPEEFVVRFDDDIPFDENTNSRAEVIKPSDTTSVRVVEALPPLIDFIRYIDGGFQFIPNGKIDAGDIIKVKLTESVIENSATELSAERYFSLLNEGDSFGETDSALVFNSDEINYNGLDRDSCLFIQFNSTPVLAINCASNRDEYQTQGSERVTVIETQINPSEIIINPEIAGKLVSGDSENDLGYSIYKTHLDNQITSINDFSDRNFVYNKYTVLVDDSTKPYILNFYPKEYTEFDYVSRKSDIKCLVTGQNIIPLSTLLEVFSNFNSDNLDAFYQSVSGELDNNAAEVWDRIESLKRSATSNELTELLEENSNNQDTTDILVVNPFQRFYSSIVPDSIWFEFTQGNIEPSSFSKSYSYLTYHTTFDERAISKLTSLPFTQGCNIEIDNTNRDEDGNNIWFKIPTVINDTTVYGFELPFNSASDKYGRAQEGYMIRTAPNPFDPLIDNVVIEYEVKDNSNIDIYIIDSGGILVNRWSEDAEKGINRLKGGWDCRNFGGRKVSRGIYYCMLSKNGVMVASWIMVTTN